MDELFLDICFLILAIGIIFIKFIIPTGIIVVGIIITKKEKNKGIILISFGAFYLLVQIIRMIASIIVYGF